MNSSGNEEYHMFPLASFSVMQAVHFILPVVDVDPLLFIILCYLLLSNLDFRCRFHLNSALKDLHVLFTKICHFVLLLEG